MVEMTNDKSCVDENSDAIKTGRTKPKKSIESRHGMKRNIYIQTGYDRNRGGFTRNRNIWGSFRSPASMHNTRSAFPIQTSFLVHTPEARKVSMRKRNINDQCRKLKGKKRKHTK